MNMTYAEAIAARMLFHVRWPDHSPQTTLMRRFTWGLEVIAPSAEAAAEQFRLYHAPCSDRVPLIVAPVLSGSFGSFVCGDSVHICPAGVWYQTPFERSAIWHEEQRIAEHWRLLDEATERIARGENRYLSPFSEMFFG